MWWFRCRKTVVLDTRLRGYDWEGVRHPLRSLRSANGRVVLSLLQGRWGIKGESGLEPEIRVLPMVQYVVGYSDRGISTNRVTRRKEQVK